MDIWDAFGIKPRSPAQEAKYQAERDSEIERLREELAAANRHIKRLERALGRNHPLTMRGAGLF